MADFDLLGADSQVNLPVNQTTGDRVGVGSHFDRAALADSNTREVIVGIQGGWRQLRQLRLFFTETFVAICICTSDDLLNELHVFLSGGKVTRATKHQGLIDSIL
jgi:hypothetical protein